MKRFGLIAMVLVFAGVLYAEGATEDEATEAGPVTLTIQSYNLAKPDDDAWVFQYWENQLGIDIEYVYIENDRQIEVLNLLIASNDEPDAFLVSSGTQLQEYVNQDVVLDVTVEEMMTYAPNTYATLNDAGDEAWAAASIGGKVYSFPQLRAHNMIPSPVIWRDDWLESVGISSIPRTLEEAERALRAFREQDPDGNGQRDTYGLSADGIPIVYGAFGYLPDIWQDRDGELVYGAVQPEVKDALSVLARWFEDGIIDPEFVTGENTGGYWALSHAFLNNRIGFTMKGQYYHWKEGLYEGDFVGQNNREFTALNPDSSFTFGGAIVGPDGAAGVIKANLAQPHRVFSSRLRDDDDRRHAILELFDMANASSYENFLLTSWGEQGTHWEYVDGLPVTMEEYSTPEALAQIGAHVILKSTYPLDYYWASQPGWQEYAVENCMTEYYTNMLTVPLPSASMYQAELEKLVDQTFTAIIRGDQSVDSFDDFVDEWFRIGGQTLTDEANAWYDGM